MIRRFIETTFTIGMKLLSHTFALLCFFVFGIGWYGLASWWFGFQTRPLHGALTGGGIALLVIFGGIFVLGRAKRDGAKDLKAKAEERARRRKYR